MTVSSLELKVPPVVVVVIVALLMWLCRVVLPDLALTFAWQTTFSLGLATAGLAIGLAGVMAFRRAATTVDPTHPEKASLVVRTGVFSVSRNPMYLGLLLLLTGWATYLGHFVAFLLLPVFIAYMNRFQISPEERTLSDLFDEDYDDYRNLVRRWI